MDKTLSDNFKAIQQQQKAFAKVKEIFLKLQKYWF